MKKTRNFASLACKARLARCALALLGVAAVLPAWSLDLRQAYEAA